jgi:hypothetical protein
MRWLEDGTIDDKLEAGVAWSEAAVLKGVRGLLEVLSLLHRRGICHSTSRPGMSSWTVSDCSWVISVSPACRLTTVASS